MLAIQSTYKPRATVGPAADQREPSLEVDTSDATEPIETDATPHTLVDIDAQMAEEASIGACGMDDTQRTDRPSSIEPPDLPSLDPVDALHSVQTVQIVEESVVSRPTGSKQERKKASQFARRRRR